MNDLVDILNLTQPQASKHLKVLRDHGLVQVRKDKQKRLYSVDAKPLQNLDTWLAPYRTLWTKALDDLGTHLEKNP